MLNSDLCKRPVMAPNAYVFCCKIALSRLPQEPCVLNSCISGVLTKRVMGKISLFHTIKPHVQRSRLPAATSVCTDGKIMTPMQLLGRCLQPTGRWQLSLQRMWMFKLLNALPALLSTSSGNKLCQEICRTSSAAKLRKNFATKTVQ